MTILADDPTAAAVLAAMPCYPVPPTGRSPAIDALRAAKAGHGLAVGTDGIMMIVRRPWIAFDQPVAPPFRMYLPYGSIGLPSIMLLCGLIPEDYLTQVVDHFRAALPNEAAAFVLWHDQDRTFALHFPEIDEATPSRLVYRPPALSRGWHLICDIHSHAAAHPFFSPTDDADDAHSTKISIVIGHFGRPAGQSIVVRFCAGGMFFHLPRHPFAGEIDAG